MYYFLFSIASVQQFIASARRTQDLWAGSFFISWLAGKAMALLLGNGLKEDDIISPNIEDNRIIGLLRKNVHPGDKNILKIASLPNIFSAKIPYEGKQAKRIAKNCEEAVKDGLKEIFDAVRSYIEEAAKTSWENNICDSQWQWYWENQYKALLEEIGIFWVLVPYENNFKEITKRAGKLHGGIKQIREFEQRREPGELCTLCGRHTVVTPSEETLEKISEINKYKGEEKRDRSSVRVWTRAFFTALSKIEEPYKLVGRIRPRERLCAICLTKRLALQAYFEEKFGRLGFDRHLFPSTADVATAYFKREVLEEWNKVKDKVESYIRDVKSIAENTGVISNSLASLKEKAKDDKQKKFLEIDGEWLHPESFISPGIKRAYGLEISQNKLDEAKNSLKDLLKAVEYKPARYYAILVGDGDGMGDIIRSLSSAEAHRKVSEALGIFSLNQVSKIVEKDHLGVLIYAGGDDVLALVNLKDIIPVIQGLSKEYQKAFNNTSFNLKPTISFGILVAHYTFPLYQATAMAQKTLKDIAKEKFQRKDGTKNAFAFQVVVRSGGNILAGGGLDKNILENLKNIVDSLGETKNRIISPKLAHLLLERADTLDASLNNKEAHLAELYFLVKRHVKKEKQKHIMLTLEKIYNDYSGWVGELRYPERTPFGENPLKALAHLLMVGNFLAGREG